MTLHKFFGPDHRVSQRGALSELESVIEAVIGHNGENKSFKLLGKISIFSLKYRTL